MATHWAGVSSPTGAYQAKLAVSALGIGGSVLDAGPEPVARPLVERPVADDDVGHAGLHCHRRLLDGPAPGSPAVVDPAEEGELPHSQASGDLDLRVGVRAEGDHPIDLVRLDAGVTEGQVDRLHCQPELAAAGLLGEFGGPDADDGGGAGKGVLGPAHRADPTGRSCRRTEPDGSRSRTVPVT